MLSLRPAEMKAYQEELKGDALGKSIYELYCTIALTNTHRRL